MPEETIYNRRRFLGVAAMSLTAAELGFIRSANGQSSNSSTADVTSIKPGTNTSFASLKQIEAGLLNVGYAEAGPAGGPPVMLLHGWWYQYYFATERGRLGYEKYRHDFAKLIWQLASPKWEFDDAAFDRSATAFDNPDHVDISIHNYRWRLSLAKGEPAYDALESRLFEAPVITAPTITLKVTPMARPTQLPVPMPINSRANMSTGTSKE